MAPDTSRFWIVLRLLVTVALLSAFFYGFSPLNLFEQLGWKLLSLSAVGVALVFLALALNAARWVLVARGMRAPLSAIEGVRLTLVGHFFSQLLPTSVGGDVVRAWGARQVGLQLRDAVSCVLFDRLFGVTVLACLMVVGMPFLATRLDSDLPLVIAAIIVGGVAFGFLAFFVLPHFHIDPRRLPAYHTLAEVAARAGELLNRPLIVASVLVLSLLGHVSALYLTALLARAFGAQLSLLDALTIVPAVMLLTNLPISIAGWGVREAGFVGGFALLGLPADAAVGTSILIGFLNLFAALPGAALFVLRWGRARLTLGPPLP